MNSSFLLFFPFLFLTSSYVPREQLSGWLDTVATWNPVTYLLEGLRSLIVDGWDWGELGKTQLNSSRLHNHRESVLTALEARFLEDGATPSGCKSSTRSWRSGPAPAAAGGHRA